MPRLSEFYGLQIYMYYNDHEPAHFHERFGEYQAKVGIHPVELIDGQLPRRALSMIVEWAATHQRELEESWQTARARRPLVRIEPLD